MDKKIILTPRFQKHYDERIEYLLQKWSSFSAYKFIEKVHKKIAIIQKYPSMGLPSSHFKNVRSVLVKPYNRIYYRDEASAIYILALIDNRKKLNRYK